jgi:hypothetical protein
MVLNIPLIDPDNVPLTVPVIVSPVVNIAPADDEVYNGFATWTRVSPETMEKNLFGAPVVVMEMVTDTGVAVGWAYTSAVRRGINRARKSNIVNEAIL